MEYFHIFVCYQNTYVFSFIFSRISGNVFKHQRFETEYQHWLPNQARMTTWTPLAPCMYMYLVLGVVQTHVGLGAAVPGGRGVPQAVTSGGVDETVDVPEIHCWEQWYDVTPLLGLSSHNHKHSTAITGNPCYGGLATCVASLVIYPFSEQEINCAKVSLN